ncbi:helix-turn-helix transcriptional regulator [Erythrobacter sp.]|uniref:helix-turn-helix domain-containing protein n=1 Tax=Erythrobacter sp. TaxID=1042 RepID=UPI001B25E0EC|nr:helix-turn-helix transcriptional regulator [Erythrobacter sp.]MBO6527851.1 helix-turn-helix transcriptional regulator [Erythrobacter sp.]MBO6530282.1 helix-turn-helix transcriptional regulator [Erythrobacter sp.]
MPKSVFSDAYDILLQELVAARKEAGLTQVELAERIKRPQPFVSYFERGERRLDLIEFVAVSRALEVDPAKLFARILKRLPPNIAI